MGTENRILEVETTHGKVVTEDNGRDASTLVLIHGNSSCRRVFDRQSESELGRTYRLVTFDLPGHGDSEDAVHPEHTYTRPGLADAVVEMLAKLDISEAALLGWSLGGHIAIEMLGKFGGVQGLILTGTPPSEAVAWPRASGVLPMRGWAPVRICPPPTSTGSRR
ncbi:alpha/beta hydrolase (plasmid) [Skermanella rosea]|uniref:alpha/beta fold hydrolase n=1 Tax=Skermanella rosea TaxID=1817965 RepID=UPI0019345261|nr:alpha/beta hydrolase [Skermanella rosea]